MDPTTTGANAGSGADLQGMMSQAQTQMQESLQMQIGMQAMASEHNSKSTIAKMTFDTEQAAISRMSAVGEAVSRLTDQQSQQIAN
jgi:hypothetical protein